MAAWAHLPNAAHIDRILTHLREHPECWGAARDVAWGAAWGAIAALTAWDDCAYLLDQTPELLRAQINLVGDNRAVLLLPTVIAMKEEV